MKTEPALRDLWLKHGCPKKMVVHVDGETFYLDEGEQTPDFLANPPKWANPSLQVVDSARTGKPKLAFRIAKAAESDAKGWCPVCGKQFVPIRSTGVYCTPHCRKNAYKKRQAQRLLARLEGVKAHARLSKQEM